MGLPSIRHSRNSTTPYRVLVVLGLLPRQCRRRCFHQISFFKSTDGHYNPACSADVVHWRTLVLWPSAILPPITRMDSFVLYCRFSPRNSALVLALRHLDLLLALHKLQPKLAVPLVVRKRTTMGHGSSCPFILRWNLDSTSLRPWQYEQASQLDHSYFRHWTWSTEMVSIPLVPFRDRVAYTLDPESCPCSSSLQSSVGLARCPRCSAGSRVRYDPTHDFDSNSYHIHVNDESDHRLCGYDCRQSYLAQ